MALAALVLDLGMLGACRKETASSAPELARRGRSLFLRGESTRGEPLVGRLGPERIELSGHVAACARCHGSSGRGSLEGGVEVPDIRPGALGHPRMNAVGAVDDRARPAYGRATLLRAITEGVSASGRKLGVAMPRYELGEVEREELLAYLERLGEAPDPGLSPTTLTLGAVLPLSGEREALGREVEAVLRAAFAEVNAEGGIFRRRLELVVEDEAAPEATARLLERGVFALVGGPSTASSASDTPLRREDIPVLLPLTTHGGDEEGSRFYLYPEESQQARLVVQHLARTDEENVLRRRPLWVVRPEDEAGLAWAWAAREEALRRELPAPLESTAFPDGNEPPPAILYTGPTSGLKDLLRQLESHGLEVPVFAPASLAGPSMVAGASQRVRFVYPPGLEGDEERHRVLSAFLGRHGLRPGNEALQRHAYAAARVLVEALRRAGTDVTRAELVHVLESMRDIDTGVTPPVTFGVDRRVGVRGAQLVRVEPEGGRLQAASPWIPLSP
ncbi:ABC-type branched-subunit amino acid transport system substrate-binding protein [Archangium gephyra]|uniref:ABC-type branched-subunit amino acid transport system substrate-binding protein n=1 Tax=Archangium gephyra TaxID=48 RepID=A0AAC8Q640_9BACT|nr:ABC transporter substrate-binding protein [Archangium gephyra]AKJ01634.1 cytochrome c, putative [Archangium gephyra]REG34448.1 ABC-type branched-subunit amino acid transport system substrate-binding protein [Archangium gephyra]